jgi:hypothetical protein
MKRIIIALILLTSITSFAQTDINVVLNKAKTKIESVNENQCGIFKSTGGKSENLF